MYWNLFGYFVKLLVVRYRLWNLPYLSEKEFTRICLVDQVGVNLAIAIGTSRPRLLVLIYRMINFGFKFYIIHRLKTPPKLI